MFYIFKNNMHKHKQNGRIVLVYVYDIALLFFLLVYFGLNRNRAKERLQKPPLMKRGGLSG